MIQYLEGNIFESHAQALVNTVNLVGVMGKGIALQFKKQYPENFILYKKACANKSIGIGKLFVTKAVDFQGERFIINFPTKTDWRKSSEYSYIEAGLSDLISIIEKYKLKSIALPPLGSGNGGLDWQRTKQIITDRLSALTDIEILIYEPNFHIKEQLKTEIVKLTDARALLLYVLFDLVSQGEYVSEFSTEKVCYFLQKFGAEKIFKLEYKPYFYGPYSGKARYLLNALNGSYIMGYSDMDKKPFEILSLIPDRYDLICSYINSKNDLIEIVEKTKSFLDGYYSDFALELLSSVDYVLSQKGDLTIDEIHAEFINWSKRKEKMFSSDNIRQAKEHLKTFRY
jgi:O-acetyl-ADP-ribose deacetylase (regulator of RNase III)